MLVCNELLHPVRPAASMRPLAELPSTHSLCLLLIAVVAVLPVRVAVCVQSVRAM